MEQMNFFDEIERLNPEMKEIKSSEWKWKFSDYPKQGNIKVFSCFACGGGSTMGYKLAGCQVIGDLEIDPKINAVYVKNHNPKYNFVMDIRDFNKREDLPEELYNLDILDGSPPCTCFSLAGDREKSWGVKKKFAEGQTEQTLDDLSFHFIDTVEKLKPKIVIMENVEGLLFGNAWGYVQQIYARFKDAGYNVRHYLLKGEKMGVPQMRHRVFFIAGRNDIGFDFSKLNMVFNYAPVTYSEIKTGELKQLSPGYKEIAEKATEDDISIGETRQRLGLTKSSFNTCYAFDNKVLNTIRASNLDTIDFAEKKYISCETAIRAQTFPEDYDFGGKSRSKIGFMCGMSVPPLMIKRIVERIKETGIFDKEEKGE